VRHDLRPGIPVHVDPQVGRDLERQGILPSDLVRKAGGGNDRLLERDTGLGANEVRVEVRPDQRHDPAAEGCDRRLVGRSVRQRDVEGSKLAGRVNDEHLLLLGEAATKDRNGEDLPRCAGHVFADGEGLFPVDLNDWERAVIDAEIARTGFVAWYRNPGSATPASPRIAYLNDQDDWASLQPDFIVVSRRTDGTLGASIVDPHGDYLADARAKLQALAAFAERFGDRFVRIESVAKVEDGSLRVLDLGDPDAQAECLPSRVAR